MRHEISIANNKTRQGLISYLQELQAHGLPVELVESSDAADIEWEDDTTVFVCFANSGGSHEDAEVDEFNQDDDYDYDDDTETGASQPDPSEVRVPPWVEEAYAKTMRFLAANERMAARWLSKRSRSRAPRRTEAVATAGLS